MAIIGGIGAYFGFYNLPAMPQIGWENLLCLFVDWWLSFNYVFLTLVQIFGFIAALFLLFKPTRQKGLYILLLLFLAYLIPLEVANYSGCANLFAALISNKNGGK